MKKVLVVMTIVALILSMATCFAEADSAIKVTVNGEELTFDQGPVLVEETPMVPMRAVFEKLGAFVNWDNDTETATAIKENSVVMIQIGNEKMFKASEAIVLDTPAMLVNDRTLIPVQAVAAAFDCDVQWNSETNEITITEKAEEPAKEEAASEETVKEETKEDVKEDAKEEVKDNTAEDKTE